MRSLERWLEAVLLIAITTSIVSVVAQIMLRM